MADLGVTEKGLRLYYRKLISKGYLLFHETEFQISLSHLSQGVAWGGIGGILRLLPWTSSWSPLHGQVQYLCTSGLCIQASSILPETSLGACAWKATL